MWLTSKDDLAINLLIWGRMPYLICWWVVGFILFRILNTRRGGYVYGNIRKRLRKANEDRVNSLGSLAVSVSTPNSSSHPRWDPEVQTSVSSLPSFSSSHLVNSPFALLFLAS